MTDFQSSPHAAAVSHEQIVQDTAPQSKWLTAHEYHLHYNTLLTTKELAKLLKVSKAGLERDRRMKRGIPYVVIGARRIRYRYRDVMAYLEKNRGILFNEIAGKKP